MQIRPLYTEFGRLLEAARNKAGLTQEALSKRVGLSRTSITNIERGRQRISLHMLYAFADALGVQPDQLMPQKQFDFNTNDYKLDMKLEDMKIKEDSLKWVKRVIESAKKEDDNAKD